MPDCRGDIMNLLASRMWSYISWRFVFNLLLVPSQAPAVGEV